jgi:hypothetical protein
MKYISSKRLLNVIALLLVKAFIVGLEQNKRLEYLHMINTNTGFTELISTKKNVILKQIPTYIENLILELKTKNYEYIL